MTIAGTTVPNPTTLNEYYEQVQHDNQAIDGSQQRNRLGAKAVADMFWEILSTTDYATIYGLVSTGAAVAYSNSTSNRGTFTFTGLPTFEEQPYEKGGSLLKGFRLKIRQV